MNLEQYQQPLEKPELELDELIGRKEICAWLRGQISPEHDESKSIAYLFAGKEGNGKRTADNALAWYFYQAAASQKDTKFAYYQIPLQQLSGKSREETAAQLEAVFGEIQKLCQKEQNQSRVIYISLGSLWTFLKHKKTARVLLYGVDALLEDARTRSEKYPVCLTGYCHKESSRLPGEVYSVFRTVEFPSPDTAQRQEYFKWVQTNNPWCGWQVPPGKLAEKTEQFTFLMLESFAESVLAWASGTLRSQAESDFLAVRKELSMTSMFSWADRKILEQQNYETAVINVPEQVIDFWLELIGKRRKIPKTAAVPAGIPAVYPAYAPSAASPAVQNVPAEQPASKTASSQDDITKRADQLEAEIQEADSFAELEKWELEEWGNSSSYDDMGDDFEKLGI